MKPDLSKKLNYLNMAEVSAFCKKHKIPVSIMIETEDGLKRSKDKDRKGIILDRIRKYLKTGIVPKPTIYSKRVCSDQKLSSPTASSKLHYGQYDKYNPKLIAVLKSLTDGKFKNGSIAREVMRDFWVAGKAPTLKEFAKAWLKASDGDDKNHAEWAFLTDLSKGESMEDWKAKRNKIAKEVLKEISRI